MAGTYAALGGTPYRPPTPIKPKTVAPVVPSQTPPAAYQAPSVNYTPQVNPLITSAIQSTQVLPTSFTPQDQLAMRNRIRATQTAQNQGNEMKIRDLMARQGLSGSGAETAAMGNMLRGNSASAQSALSNLGIENARTNLSNIYNRAGMTNQLTGMAEQGRQFNVGTQLDLSRLGEQGRQFDTSTLGDMYKYQNNFDYQAAQDAQAKAEYDRQLRILLDQLGINSGTGSYSSLGG